MRGHTYLTSVVASFAVALLWAWAPAAAEDAAYCVTCAGPAQTYLCQVTGEGVRRNDAIKLYCIVRTAKEGGHASCGARNEIAGCHGITKVYAYDGPSLPAVMGQTPAEERGIDEAFTGEAESEAPKTLVEATGRAYSASRRGIRNVRARFGGGKEEDQSRLPSATASAEPLPPLPGESPSPLTPLPSTMTPETKATLQPPAAEPEGRIRRSAQGVGTFAKKSYRCVRSLFFNCRSQPQAVGSN
jgi:hypothetical protein